MTCSKQDADAGSGDVQRCSCCPLASLCPLLPKRLGSPLPAWLHPSGQGRWWALQDRSEARWAPPPPAPRWAPSPGGCQGASEGSQQWDSGMGGAGDASCWTSHLCCFPSRSAATTALERARNDGSKDKAKVGAPGTGRLAKHEAVVLALTCLFAAWFQVSCSPPPPHSPP